MFLLLPFFPLHPPLRVEGPSKSESKAAKGAEMLKMLETTSAADLAAAADARKESAYMDSVRCSTEFVSQKYIFFLLACILLPWYLQRSDVAHLIRHGVTPVIRLAQFVVIAFFIISISLIFTYTMLFLPSPSLHRCHRV